MIDSRPLLQPIRQSSASIVAGLRRRQQGTFPVRVLGRSDAPVLPQRVGNWWLEPLNRNTELPPRAKQRLQTLLASGIVPRAVVVFHEIPGSNDHPSWRDKAASRIHQYVHQDLPVLADRFGDRVQRNSPRIARGALGLGLKVLPIAGVAMIGLIALLGHLATTTVAVVATAAIDPCLVVVTQDGYWVEIDRWYS